MPARLRVLLLASVPVVLELLSVLLPIVLDPVPVVPIVPEELPVPVVPIVPELPEVPLGLPIVPGVEVVPVVPVVPVGPPFAGLVEPGTLPVASVELPPGVVPVVPVEPEVLPDVPPEPDWALARPRASAVAAAAMTVSVDLNCMVESP